MRVSLVVATLVVAASVVEAVSGTTDGPASRFANLLLVTLAPPVIVLGVIRSLRKRSQVTIEAVFGVLCLYILLGMFFALVSAALDRYAGPNCLYFSFTTLTTVGFGDLTSRTNLGHTLSSLEALTGQIYLVTVVSLLVGNLRRRGPAE
jgi:hypothetical protein